MSRTGRVFLNFSRPFFREILQPTGGFISRSSLLIINTGGGCPKRVFHFWFSVYFARPFYIPEDFFRHLSATQVRLLIRFCFYLNQPGDFPATIPAPGI